MDYKYPRTYHVPWSPGATADDRKLSTLQHFVGKNVVVTEKRDGENTTLTPTKVYSRSVDGGHHISKNWVKNFWSQRQHVLPAGWRVCGEDLFAVHSIEYDSLYKACREKFTCFAVSMKHAGFQCSI